MEHLRLTSNFHDVLCMSLTLHYSERKLILFSLNVSRYVILYVWCIVTVPDDVYVSFHYLDNKYNITYYVTCVALR